jgi:ATP-dependent protease ClpP protease subunit
MKKIALITIILAFIATVALAIDSPYGYFTKEDVAKIAKEVAGKKDDPFRCPKSQISDQSQCFNCHTQPSFKLKEAPPDETYTFPYKMHFEGNVAVFKVRGGIDASDVSELESVLEYLSWHPEISTLQVEILSGGGSLFVAWQLIAALESVKSKYAVRTVVHGFAASAAFLLWMAGDERLTYPNAILMHHELWTFEMFKMEDVSSSEETARVKRFFQDNIHDYLVARSILTKEQLDE